MVRALLTFSNGETLELYSSQKIIPISKHIDKNGDINVSPDRTYELCPHHNHGLIKSITELLSSCEFFELFEDQNKAYKTSAVVSIENL